MRIALVSREVHPYVGGGIAPYITAAARTLRKHATVTVVTSERHRALHEEMTRAGDSRLLPDDVRLVWVPEHHGGPTDSAYSPLHGYSADVLTCLKEAYPDGGPELIEFCDYLGEGFVTVQAAHTADPWLDRTVVAVRTHTTSWLAQVLDGHVAQDFASRAVFEMERYVLEHADHVLWPGGDVLGTYERAYGAERLAPDVQVPDAFLVESTPAATVTPPATDGLRLLFLGRTERRKGIAELIRALRGLAERNWHLTVVGGDTHTGPLGSSLRAQLELMAEGDDRITFVDAVPRHEVGELIEQSHLVMLPSLWECWPNVGREALMHNRPVFATPVGGLLAMVRPGRSGFLTRDTSMRSMRKALEGLVRDPGQVDDLIASGGPRQVFEELNDDGSRLVQTYGELARRGPGRPSRRALAREPLVSVVVPYYRLEEHVRETVESVARQTYPSIEVVVLNDGCFRPEEQVLDDLRREFGVRVVASPNSGLSTARNTGIEVSRGTYVLPLDADDVIDPSLVARCVDVLERRTELQYVTSWLSYMDERGRPVADSDGYRPFGNWSRLLVERNVAGSATALFRRSLFDDLQYHPDLTSYEDWYLYQELQADGLFGAVIPENLITYRVRSDSMTRQHAVHHRELLRGEMAAHLEERKIAWQPRNV